jgi:hypothetical protein
LKNTVGDASLTVKHFATLDSHGEARHPEGMTNTNRPEMTETQTARYQELREQGQPAQRAARAARAMIGSSDGRRGPRAPYTNYGKVR